MERQETKQTIYKIPVRQIVANTNPRNPLSLKLQKLGWTVFNLAPPPGPATPTLWLMATSDNPDERKRFADLMLEHDPDFCSWAQTFITQGQLEAIEVRDNGKRGDGENTYTLVFGCRRCLAVLFNWAMTGKPKEPLVDARLVKGNNSTLLQRASVENTHKPPSVVERARTVQMDLNLGVAEADVCAAHGISPTTLSRWQEILALPPEVLQKIHEGRTTATKALEDAKAAPGSHGEAVPKLKVRPKKTIEAAYGEFSPESPEGRVLGWILGLRNHIKD